MGPAYLAQMSAGHATIIIQLFHVAVLELDISIFKRFIPLRLHIFRIQLIV